MLSARTNLHGIKKKDNKKFITVSKLKQKVPRSFLARVLWKKSCLFCLLNLALSKPGNMFYLQIRPDYANSSLLFNSHFWNMLTTGLGYIKSKKEGRCAVPELFSLSKHSTLILVELHQFTLAEGLDFYVCS